MSNKTTQDKIKEFDAVGVRQHLKVIAIPGGVRVEVDHKAIQKKITKLVEESFKAGREEVIEKIEKMSGTVHRPMEGMSNVEWIKKTYILNYLKDHE